jgi:hypothetical protein
VQIVVARAGNCDEGLAVAGRRVEHAPSRCMRHDRIGVAVHDE